MLTRLSSFPGNVAPGCWGLGRGGGAALGGGLRRETPALGGAAFRMDSQVREVFFGLQVDSHPSGATVPAGQRVARFFFFGFCFLAVKNTVGHFTCCHVGFLKWGDLKDQRSKELVAVIAMHIHGRSRRHPFAWFNHSRNTAQGGPE